MHFFSVCKFEKSKYIPKNCFSLQKFYGNHKYSVIVPSYQREKFIYFYKKIGLDYINVVDENKYLSLNEFKSIYEEISAKNSIKDTNTTLIWWYYQQALKLTHILDDGSDDGYVMIDADTILLKKIEFFKGFKSVVHKALYEKNIHYKDTCLEVFGNVSEPWFSSTVQTFAITNEEIILMRKCFDKYITKKDLEKTGLWLSKIILKSTISTKLSINGPYISEQDLIATCKLLNYQSKVEPVKFLRSGIVGEMSDIQKKIASFFGYSYVSYENWIVNKKRLSLFDFVICLVINVPLIHKFLKSAQIISRKIFKKRIQKIYNK